MMKTFPFVALSMAFALSGCASLQSGQQLITEHGLLSAQVDLNRQIADYMAAARTYRSSPPPKAKYWCGDGDVDFDLDSVTLDFLVTSDVTDAANAGAAGQVSVVTVGGAFNGSRENTSSQELKYVEHILEDKYQPAKLTAGEPRSLSQTKQVVSSEGRLESYEIASKILALRNALIHSDMVEGDQPKPCFIDFDPTKPADAPHQFIISIKAINDTKGGVTLGLGPLTLGGSVESKPSFANTITIAFKQHGLTSKSQIGSCLDDPHKFCVFEPQPVKPAPIGASTTQPKPDHGAPPPPPNPFSGKKMCVVVGPAGGFDLGFAPCPDQSDTKPNPPS